MHKLQSIILAGGNGERLWPHSNNFIPKQFLKLYGNYSPLQNTLMRNNEISPMAVIVSPKDVKITQNQIKEIGVNAKIIVEPSGKNTAPCAIVAALFGEMEGADRIILLPVDHHIKKQGIYIESINEAAKYANDLNIVTLGIKPSNPDTSYGYLKTCTKYNNSLFQISKFEEKPNTVTAQKYISSPDYYWNSGIFIYSPQCLIEMAKILEPCMYYSILASFKKRKEKGNVIRLHKESYKNIEANSIDYAFMEKYKNIIMLKGDFSWKDIGSWHSVWEANKKDKNGNVIKGNSNIYTNNVSTSIIYSDKIPTIVMGLKDVVVVNTNDASLVMHKSESHKIKEAKNHFYDLGVINNMKPANDNNNS